MSLEETCADILDAWISVDNRIVTCKLLSRLMRIRIDAAAELMAQWHKSHSNAHATYVLCGSNPVGNGKPSTPETSIPAMSSDPSLAGIVPKSSTPKKTQAVLLVRQDDLDQVKAQYETILGCQIYSLEPARLTDLAMLTSCNIDVQEAMAGQSNKIADLSKTYGIIFNFEVDELNNNPQAQQKSVPPIKPIIKPRLPKDESSSNIILPSADAAVTAQHATTDTKTIPPIEPAPAMKRSASSSLASAFAKTPKPKVKSQAQVTAKQVTSTEVKSRVEDSSTNTTNIKALETTSSKQDSTKAELEAMMMEEDEVVPLKPNVDNGIQAAPGKDDEEMLDAEDWSASDTEMKEVVATKPVAVPVRPRGRKKVKKQVHTKDAKGYMVTREEWEWVSCDEDEIPVPSLARQSSTASGTSKSKAPAKKKSTGGGIASYFTKK